MLGPEVRLPGESDTPRGARICVAICLQQSLHLKHNQLFAEKERDAGFAADSPIDEILHMLKLTVEDHDAL